MKKICEQDWKVRMTNVGPIIDDVSGHPEGEAVCMVYAPMSYEGRRVTLEESDAIVDERARFIASAPKMARALVAQGRFIDASNTRWHSEACLGNGEEECEPECVQAQDALRSAGVL